MKFANILNEVNIEFGAGKSLAVTDATNPRFSTNKTGAAAKDFTKTMELKNCSPATRSCVENIVNYLKKKQLWDKVASEQNFDTTDLVFKADGSCTVNFDKGGSIMIPNSITGSLSASVKNDVKKNFKKILASCCTDKKASCCADKEKGTIKEDYFPY